MNSNLNYGDLNDAIQYVSEKILSEYGHAFISSPTITKTTQSQCWASPNASGVYWKLMRYVNMIPINILTLIKGDFRFIFRSYEIYPGEEDERSEEYHIHYEVYYKNQLLTF